MVPGAAGNCSFSSSSHPHVVSGREEGDITMAFIQPYNQTTAWLEGISLLFDLLPLIPFICTLSSLFLLLSHIPLPFLVNSFLFISIKLLLLTSLPASWKGAGGSKTSPPLLPSHNKRPSTHDGGLNLLPTVEQERK